MVKSDSIRCSVGRLPFISRLCVIRKDILSESIIIALRTQAVGKTVAHIVAEERKRKKKILRAGSAYRHSRVATHEINDDARVCRCANAYTRQNKRKAKKLDIYLYAVFFLSLCLFASSFR